MNWPAFGKKSANSGEGFQLKIIINKELWAKIIPLTKFGLRLVDIFNQKTATYYSSGKIYFLMDSLVERVFYDRAKCLNGLYDLLYHRAY